jgi:inorganic pyrophosphatase
MAGMEVEAIIEIPKGSRNKYEVDHDTGLIWLDRMLFTATQYPADYGYIPETLADDGDPLDILVLLDEATFPGCHMWTRPVGLFRMADEKGVDAKILAVPSKDPRWKGIMDIDDLAPFLLDEIRHFFEVYKALEPGKDTSIEGWGNAASALAEIDRSRLAAGELH